MGMVMSKKVWRVRLVLFVLGLACISTSAAAQDRAGYIGISILTPVTLKPDTKRGDEVFALDLAYFFRDELAGVLTWDFGLENTKRVNLAVGPQVFFFRDSRVKPYFTTRFIYSLDPKNDLGWRLNGGVEWDLRWLTGLDNLAAYTDVGVSQIFARGGPNLVTLELFRAGMSWSF